MPHNDPPYNANKTKCESFEGYMPLHNVQVRQGYSGGMAALRRNNFAIDNEGDWSQRRLDDIGPQRCAQSAYMGIMECSPPICASAFHSLMPNEMHDDATNINHTFCCRLDIPEWRMDRNMITIQLSESLNLRSIQCFGLSYHPMPWQHLALPSLLVLL